MMLLSPLIMIPIFGSMLWRGRHGIPERLLPLIAIGGMGLVLLGMLQLMANQFGFDRDGFRVFVLSAAPGATSSSARTWHSVRWPWVSLRSCSASCRRFVPCGWTIFWR